MSKEKIRDLIICLIAVGVLVLAITTNVFASDDQNLEDILGNENSNVFNEISNSNNSNVNRNINNSVNNSVSNSNVNNSNVNNNRINTNTNTNKTGIPDTGVDYSVLFIIAICGTFAVYAYRKIKAYKGL